MLGVAVGLLLVVSVLGPAVGGLAALRDRRGTGLIAVRATAAAGAAGVLVAIASGFDHAGSWSSGGRLLVDVDRIGALLLVFVLLATLVAQAYAVRSLRGDPARATFFAASGCAATATTAVVLAADLWVLVLAWVGVSLATAALLRHDGRPSSSAAARRAATSFLVGDLALLVAAVVAAATLGPVTLRPEQMSAVAGSGTQVLGVVGLTAVLAMAAVIAAITRCALPPAHMWLPMSVAAPTPSSAVLHAGIVNGGGIVLIRFAPVLGKSSVATGIALAGGCVGVLVGSAVSRTRADVKTTLAWSTVSQMGFMIVQCVTGLLGPAVIHMVAHGMYKANLFLGSGSGLAQVHRRSRPERRSIGGVILRTLVVIAISAAAVGFALLVVRPNWFEGVAGLVLLGFVAAAVAQAVSAWMTTRQERSVLDLFAFAGLVLATTASIGVAALLKYWLATSLPEVDPTLEAVGAVALALTAVAGWMVSVMSRPAIPGRRVADRAYLWAAHIGDPARVARANTSSEVRR